MLGHGFGPPCGSIRLSPLAHSDWSSSVQCLGPLTYGSMHYLCALLVCAVCAHCLCVLPAYSTCALSTLHACSPCALCLCTLPVRCAHYLLTLLARSAYVLCMLPSEARTASDWVMTKSLPTICFPSSPYGHRANPWDYVSFNHAWEWLTATLCQCLCISMRRLINPPFR